MSSLGTSYNMTSRVYSSPIRFKNTVAAGSKFGRVVDILLDDTREWNNEATKEKYPIGTVKYTKLNTDPTAANAINYALPSNTGTSFIPNVNELIELVHKPTPDLQFLPSMEILYYSGPVNIWGSPTNNSLPASSYDGQNPQANDVLELTDINPLYPFPGDILTEGRQGQSIRIGGYKSAMNPLVDISNNGQPYIIISNGQIKTDNGVDHIVEDINKDPNSMYFLSNHKLPLVAANSKRDAYTQVPLTSDKYKGNQVVVNGGRLYFNAKEESAFISAKESIGLNANTLNFDGKEYACIDATKIYLGVKSRTSPEGIAEPAVLGNQLDNFLSVMLDALQNIGEAMKVAEAQTGGPIGSLNTEGYCVTDTCVALKTLMNQMKSKKVFIE
jgi:hypothetical protein